MPSAANKNMQRLNLLLSVLILLFTSCEKSNNNDIIIDEDVITFVELNASQYGVNQTDTLLTIGKYQKFSFSEGDTVSHDNWDVAFSGTTIIINGGESFINNQPNRSGNAAVYIATGLMSDIRTVDLTKLVQDYSNSAAIVDDFGFTGMGWCTYSGLPDHIISPIPGKILVFRTHDNKYAKVEILSFYDNPITSEYGGFYTFNYVYQSAGEINF
jgi:hypothetical protein